MKTVVNAAGRRVPLDIPGLGCFDPYQGPFALAGKGCERRGNAPVLRASLPGRSKLQASLRSAIEASGLRDGMTVSFHHHLRNGDRVVARVLAEIDAMGIRDLTLAPSSLLDAHECVVEYARKGVISRIFTSGMRDEVGKAVSRGELDIPVIIRSHGGRARAIEEGSIAIDVAFLGAPACDRQGNMTGGTGPSACGSLGYAMMDAAYAGHVIALTDNLVEYPLTPMISIPQYQVDSVVEVEELGDPQQITSGSIKVTQNPVDLAIARNAFDLFRASGLLKPGFSFQVGAGGASIAVASFVRDYILQKGIKGSFGLGGISRYLVQLLEEGLFECLFDVQSFDPAVAYSVLNNPRHVEVSASWYANPFNKGCLVNDLDFVALAALEVDTAFNVNVMTGHNGVLRGASGGHSDTAAGADLAVVLLPSMRGGVPSVKDRVQTIVTPGDTVDAIVTEKGICINPARDDLLELALKQNLPVVDIETLKQRVEDLTGKPEPVEMDESKVVAVVEYRDGTLLDTVYRKPE